MKLAKKSRAVAKALTAGIVKSRFGLILLAQGQDGLRALYLGERPAALLGELARDYPDFVITRDDRALERLGKTVVDYLEGRIARPRIALAAAGTEFQNKVWRAMAKIPRGQTRSYAELARAIDRPKAVRAVAGACAANPVSILIPCHRVMRSDGGIGGYRWGITRKRAILRAEGASA